MAAVDKSTLNKFVRKYKNCQKQLRFLLIRTFPQQYQEISFSHIIDHRILPIQTPTVQYLAYAEHHRNLLGCIYKNREQRHLISPDNESHTFARETFKWMYEDAMQYIKLIEINIDMSIPEVQSEKTLYTNQYSVLNIEELTEIDSKVLPYRPLSKLPIFKEGKNRRKRVAKLKQTDDELIAKYKKDDKSYWSLPLSTVDDINLWRSKQIWDYDVRNMDITYELIAYIVLDYPTSVSRQDIKIALMNYFSIYHQMFGIGSYDVKHLRIDANKIKPIMNRLNLKLGITRYMRPVDIVKYACDATQLERLFIKVLDIVNIDKYINLCIGYDVTTLNRRDTISCDTCHFYATFLEIAKYYSVNVYRRNVIKSYINLTCVIDPLIDDAEITFHGFNKDSSKCVICDKMKYDTLNIPCLKHKRKNMVKFCLECTLVPPNFRSYEPFSRASYTNTMLHIVRLMAHIDPLNLEQLLKNDLVLFFLYEAHNQ